MSSESLSSARMADYFVPAEAKKGGISSQVHRFSSKTVLADYKVILMGLPDEEGQAGGVAKDGYKGADAIRGELYGLSAVLDTHAVLDMGNIRSPLDKGVSAGLLATVLHYFLDRGMYVVLFGGPHGYELGHYMAYEGMERDVSLVSIDSRMDMLSDHAYGRAHLDDIFAYRPNYLFHYMHLAHQSYFIHRDAFRYIGNQGFEAMRLGLIRENLLRSEPLLRGADIFSFDASALSFRYAPGGIGSGVFGLTGEEACQMAWYAGMSPRLRSAGLHGFDATKDDSHATTAKTMATMVWYLLEGMASQPHTPHFDRREYVRYTVEIKQTDYRIDFYKSALSERWWMEVPFDRKAWRLLGMVSCSYEDYLCALEGEVPPRWLLMRKKMN